MINDMLIVLIITFNPMLLIRYFLKFSFSTCYHTKCHSLMNKNVVQLKCKFHFSTLAKPEVWQHVSYL